MRKLFLVISLCHFEFIIVSIKKQRVFFKKNPLEQLHRRSIKNAKDHFLEDLYPEIITENELLEQQVKELRFKKFLNRNDSYIIIQITKINSLVTPRFGKKTLSKKLLILQKNFTVNTLMKKIRNGTKSI